jgi:hypothetical protein
VHHPLRRPRRLAARRRTRTRRPRRHPEPGRQLGAAHAAANSPPTPPPPASTPSSTTTPAASRSPTSPTRPAPTTPCPRSTSCTPGPRRSAPAGPSPAPAGGRSTASPAATGPIHDQCAHVSCGLLAWRHYVADPLTVTTERQLLSRHLEWAATQPWIGTLWAQVRALRAQLQAVNGTGNLRVGACPQCGGRLSIIEPRYTSGPAVGGDHQWAAECDRDVLHRWEGKQLIRLRLELDEKHRSGVPSEGHRAAPGRRDARVAAGPAARHAHLAPELLLRLVRPRLAFGGCTLCRCDTARQRLDDTWRPDGPLPAGRPDPFRLRRHRRATAGRPGLPSASPAPGYRTRRG